MNIQQIIQNAVTAVAENEPEMLERPIPDLLDDMAMYAADLEEYLQELEQFVPIKKTIADMPEWKRLIEICAAEVAKHV